MAIHAVVPDARFVSKADVKALAADLAPGRCGRHALPRARAQARRAARRPRDRRGAAAGADGRGVPRGHDRRPATACCRSTPTCCRRRSRPRRRCSRWRCASRTRAMPVSAAVGVRRRDHACCAACGSVGLRRRRRSPAWCSCRRARRPDVERRELAGAAARRHRRARSASPTLAQPPGRLTRDRCRRGRRRRLRHRRGSSCGSASAPSSSS